MRQGLGRTLATAAHLAALGIIGPVTIAVLASIFGAGVAALFALGIGVLLLAVVAFAFWAIAWFEEARVAGLFGLDVPRRRMPRSPRTDWVRVPHTVWVQVVDRHNLRSTLHFVIISMIGLVALIMLQVAVTGAWFSISAAIGQDAVWIVPWFELETDRVSAIVLGAIGLVVGLAAVYVLTLVHRAISTQMMLPSREAELTQRAETATQRRNEAMRAMPSVIPTETRRGWTPSWRSRSIRVRSTSAARIASLRRCVAVSARWVSSASREGSIIWVEIARCTRVST